MVRSHPLGVGRGRAYLRAPASWPKETPWPPSVEDAEALIRSKARRPGMRNIFRSALAAFGLAAAFATRGMRVGGNPDDIVEGYSLFAQMAASDMQAFVGYRALSLYNATICMQALPSRQAKQVAGDLLLRATKAISEDPAGAMAAVLSSAGQKVATVADPEPLRWRGPRSRELVPSSPQASERVRSVPKSIEGSWSGIRSTLLDRGLSSPERCRIDSPVVVAQRRGLMLEVSEA